jgi:hypothetical protein
MDESSLLGESRSGWRESSKKERISTQCKKCINYNVITYNKRIICKYHLIKFGSKKYRETYPWGKCKQYKTGG